MAPIGKLLFIISRRHGMHGNQVENILLHARKDRVILCAPDKELSLRIDWSGAAFVSYRRKSFVTCPECLKRIEELFEKEETGKKRVAKIISLPLEPKPKEVGRTHLIETEEDRVSAPKAKKEALVPEEMEESTLEAFLLASCVLESKECEPRPPREVKETSPSPSPAERKTYWGIDVSKGIAPSDPLLDPL